MFDFDFRIIRDGNKIEDWNVPLNNELSFYLNH